MGAKKIKKAVAGQPAAAGEKKSEIDQPSQPSTEQEEDQSVLTVGKIKELLGAYNNPIVNRINNLTSTVNDLTTIVVDLTEKVDKLESENKAFKDQLKKLKSSCSKSKINVKEQLLVTEAFE